MFVGYLYSLAFSLKMLSKYWNSLNVHRLFVLSSFWDSKLSSKLGNSRLNWNLPAGFFYIKICKRLLPQIHEQSKCALWTDWPPKRSEKLRSGGRFDCNVHCQSAFSTDRPPQRGFWLRFGGQSVHNAHLLCSCNWGIWCIGNIGELVCSMWWFIELWLSGNP